MTIAQLVFGRDASFDAQADFCFRIEASRIRRELERYYLLQGSEDDIVLTVPKGTYIPSFRVRNMLRQEASVSRKPQPMPVHSVSKRKSIWSHGVGSLHH